MHLELKLATGGLLFLFILFGHWEGVYKFTVSMNHNFKFSHGDSIKSFTATSVNSNRISEIFSDGSRPLAQSVNHELSKNI